MVCKPPDTTGATANRFENDLVRQPQADYSTVSISLIIPRTDRGSLSVSVIDQTSRSQMWVRYGLIGPRRYGYSCPPKAKGIHRQPLHFERVYPRGRSARLSQIPFSPLPGFKTNAQEEAVAARGYRKTHFIVRGQTAGVFGSGWKCTHLLPLTSLLPVILHKRHLPSDTI